MKLYELAEEYNNLMLIDDVDGDFSTALAQLEGEIEDKVINVAYVSASFDMDIESIKTEEKRLSSMRKVLENRVDSIKNYLQFNMEAAGIDKVKTTLKEVVLQKSPASVNILDETLIPARHIKVIPESYQVVKKSITDEWKKTGEVCEGAEVISDKKHIRIK